MSEHKPEKKSTPPKSYGWMAEYEDEHKLLEAARRVRDSGYTRIDAFTPFPLHGIDEALGIKATVLPWFTFFAGATGTVFALTMQWWTNAYDYPYLISGKPFASWPAFIPVTFELTVLFAAFTTFLGMLALNGLPQFSNPVFTNPKFDRVTDDRFFLWIDARDKYFNSDKVRNLLVETDAIEVEEVREDESSTEVPRPILIGIFTMILITIIPAAIVVNMRNSKSDKPRWHVFFDMDFQPKRKTQTSTTLFADRRVQRPPVPGTIARGELELSDPFYLGYEPEKLAAAGTTNTLFVSLNQETQASAPAGDGTQPDDQGQAMAAAPAAEGELNLPWLEEFPIEPDDNSFKLGKQKFEQNCAVCHGFSGYGDGLVSQRALNLAQGYWLTPASMHDERIQKQPVGQIYYTITNGKGKMGGYAASLNPRERWAVVFYVRALQRSQNAREEDVPQGQSVVDLTSSATVGELAGE